MGPLNTVVLLPLSLADLGPTVRGLVVLAVFLAVGAFGIWFNFALYTAAFSGGGDEPSAPKVNCPSCGARTTTDPAECDYCGDALVEADAGAST